MKYVLTSALLLGLLTGCETIVDVPMPAHKPRLALAYTLSNQAPDSSYQATFQGRSMTLSVSESIRSTRYPKFRGDANVELLDASGQVVERFAPRYRAFNPYSNDSIQGYYKPMWGFAATPGQRYTLRATAPGVEPVESSLTMPAPATIGSASFTNTTSPNEPSEYSLTGWLEVKIPDNANTTDYYVAYGRVLDANGKLWGYLMRDYQDQDSDENLAAERFKLSVAWQTMGLNVFADLNTNGRTISLTGNTRSYYQGAYDPTRPSGGAGKPAAVEVTISTVTRETYEFYQSLNRYQNADGNPFSEPAPLASNIQNGYGLFGGSSDVKMVIPIQ